MIKNITIAILLIIILGSCTNAILKLEIIENSRQYEVLEKGPNNYKATIMEFTPLGHKDIICFTVEKGRGAGISCLKK